MPLRSILVNNIVIIIMESRALGVLGRILPLGLLIAIYYPRITPGPLGSRDDLLLRYLRRRVGNDITLISRIHVPYHPSFSRYFLSVPSMPY